MNRSPDPLGELDARARGIAARLAQLSDGSDRRPRSLISKLLIANDIGSDDIKALEDATADRQTFLAGTDLVSEDDAPGHLRLILSGYACRYKMLSSGRRSIMALMLPGDFCDMHIWILGYMDHSICAVSDCEVAHISPQAVEVLLRGRARMMRAFWWATLVDEATLREWLVNMGQRPADRQMAHLFCEIYVRMKVTGNTNGRSFHFPLTQEQLADTLGISPVYTNRLVQRLRGSGLVTWQDRTMRIDDYHALSLFAGFDPKYLHLDPPRS